MFFLLLNLDKYMENFDPELSKIMRRYNVVGLILTIIFSLNICYASCFSIFFDLPTFLHKFVEILFPNIYSKLGFFYGLLAYSTMFILNVGAHAFGAILVNTSILYIYSYGMLCFGKFKILKF